MLPNLNLWNKLSRSGVDLLRFNHCHFIIDTRSDSLQSQSVAWSSVFLQLDCPSDLLFCRVQLTTTSEENHAFVCPSDPWQCNSSPFTICCREILRPLDSISHIYVRFVLFFPSPDNFSRLTKSRFPLFIFRQMDFPDFHYSEKKERWIADFQFPATKKKDYFCLKRFKRF